tara:strand:- start:212 stop:367 length:156 start_codon:yes stop_codon:yes gene_type:complete
MLLDVAEEIDLDAGEDHGKGVRRSDPPLLGVIRRVLELVAVLVVAGRPGGG